MVCSCGRCGRLLTDPHSVEAGYGPVCAAHLGAAVQEAFDMWQGKFVDGMPMAEFGIVLERGADGDTLITNVPHLLTHHSPTGYEWGYGGSGPADLALNIVESILRHIDHKGALGSPAWDKYRPYADTWRIYQDFKFHFIAGGMREPESVTVIDWGEAVGFVLEHLQRQIE